MVTQLGAAYKLSTRCMLCYVITSNERENVKRVQLLRDVAKL